MSRVLIIDDENDICFLISEILNDESFTCVSAQDSTQALTQFNKFNPDLIILDVWLGNSEFDGIELLSKFKDLNPIIPIIIISGHGTVDMAVNAIKNGAYDFIEKPFNSDKLIVVSKRAIQSASLLKENNKLKSMVNTNISLVGRSNFITQLNKNIIKLAKSNSRILIEGESGSGKQLLAQILHQNSIFSKSVNTVFDIRNTSEYEIENFFTDIEEKINENIFVQANNSSIIIDNIEFLNLNLQKKLLLFLENNNFFIKNKINIKQKVIFISSKNIENEVNIGNFLRSLYDRISVIKLRIPSIKSRRDDIIPIYEYYLKYYNKNKDYKFTLSQNAKSKLELYDWPGNVSQIMNYAEKTIILNQDLNIKKNFILDNLPLDMGEYVLNKNNLNDFELSLKDARNNFEKNYLLSQIKRFNGNIKKISDFTGMERTALYRKFKSLNISTEKK